MDPLLLFGGGGVIVFARESEALSLIWIFQGYAQWVGGLDPRPPSPFRSANALCKFKTDQLVVIDFWYIENIFLSSILFYTIYLRSK